jgi:KDO2-lipid IV(A) lauroyltransferase
VLTYFPERLPNGTAGYRVIIGPAFEDFPGDDVVCKTSNASTPARGADPPVPEQYLWMHRRFKGLSADYPDYYGRDSRNRGPVQAPKPTT